MQALQFSECGAPDVLHVADAPEPHAGPGQVRIAVRATSVNVWDTKVRAGAVPGMPRSFPSIPGLDAAGLVDEVGDGVTSVAIGDRVFGLGSRTAAEHAVLDLFAAMPEAMTFEQGAALGVVAETAARSLDLIDLPSGSTVLIDGAAGGVGSAATQLAIARGLRVIGTGSPSSADYLRSLGATPTTYGAGLPARVAAIAPVDGAIDVAGKGSVPDLIGITGDASRVVSVADFSADKLGAKVADSSRGRASYALAEVARLTEEGRFIVAIELTCPMSEGAQAHRLSQSGHVHGKVVITIP